MKHYKLRYVMHDPSEETEDKYMAEIPALPGCRAWGDTPEDTLDILESVAAAFIEIDIERGYNLPAEGQAALTDNTQSTRRYASTNEVLVVATSAVPARG